MSREPITFDPSAWTGMSSRLWPSPKDHPYPRPLQARASSRNSILFGCGMLLVTGVSGLIWWYADRSPKAAYIALLYVACALVPFSYAWSEWKKGSRRFEIEMNADGLKIPECFDEKVPWSEVTHVDYRHPSLTVEIRDEDRFKPTDSRSVATWKHAMACPNSGPLPAGVPGGLEVPPKVLFEALQAHRAHFGRGGQPSPT